MRNRLLAVQKSPFAKLLHLYLFGRWSRSLPCWQGIHSLAARVARPKGGGEPPRAKCELFVLD